MKISKKELDKRRAKFLAFEIFHSEDWMKKHLPKTGAFKNRFVHVKTHLGTGKQIWKCKYLHFVFPGYKTVEVDVTISMIPHSSKWRNFEIKIEPPSSMDFIEKMRIQKEGHENIRYEMIHHLSKYF